jgi:hypothetical protein
MIDQKTRAALKADIAAHLLTAGGANWSTVRDRYPTISAASFWRILREVKAAQGAASSHDGEQTLMPPSAENSPPEIDLAGTVMPWLRCGLTPDRMFAEYERLLADAERLRAYSTDADGNIIRPAAFLQSVKLRERLLNEIQAACRELPPLKAWKQMFQRLSDDLEEFDRDFAIRLNNMMKRFIDGMAPEKNALL